jgi:bifunctional non-homologous end joining protein LigD
MVDGEVIALNERGVPDFRVLQHRMHVRNAREVARLVTSVPATLMVFDLLRLDGQDLTTRPLEERRALLEELPLGDSKWQVPAAYDDGDMLFEATLQQGLEGVVSKRRGSRYRFDARSEDWRKLAHRHRGSFVVGGWRPQTGTTDRLASLLVGEQTPDGLLYRGRVGSGIAGATSTRLAALMAPLAASSSPFADEVPRIDAAGTFWVEPRVVVDIDTHGLGYERLRQPSFQGVRDDLAPEDLA